MPSVVRWEGPQKFAPRLLLRRVFQQASSRGIHFFDLDSFCGNTTYRVIGEPIALDSFGKKENRMARSLQIEITLESRLDEIPATIGKLQSDPELLSRIEGREAAFLIALREALVNAITHGNRNERSRRVYVQYTCEPDNALSISIRDEGDGFEPRTVLTPKDIGVDRGWGIFLMISCMDEVRFRKNGSEVYMHMKGRNKP
jgi:serine/threonine-protein kinase RsbW